MKGIARKLLLASLFDKEYGVRTISQHFCADGLKNRDNGNFQVCCISRLKLLKALLRGASIHCIFYLCSLTYAAELRGLVSGIYELTNR